MNYKKQKDSTMIIRESDHYSERMEQLNPGVYKVHNVGQMKWQLGLEPLELLNGLTTFTDSPVMQTFIRDVDVFLTDEVKEKYAQMKINHQIGYILHGKPGTGKTSLALMTMKILCEKYGAIALDCTSQSLNFVIFAIQQIRQVQSNPIIVFFDEIDHEIDRDEYTFLKFLDGTESQPNLIVIGATNDLDDIPQRIRNRRSRIKRCIEIKSLPLGVYEQYAKERLLDTKGDILVELCGKAMAKELTIDQFKNVMIDIQIYNVGIDEAIEDNIKLFSEDDEMEEEAPSLPSLANLFSSSKI